MTLPARSFSGPSFFRVVRTDMNRNRGLFAGSDGDLSHISMDASFYRMDMFVRPDSQTFTDSAKTLPSNVRAVANGQIFGTSRLDYNYMGPGPEKWQGEIIVAGTARTGNPASAPAFRNMGQWNGCSQVAIGVSMGDPSKVTPGYLNAMGRLLPLVEGRTGAASGPLGDWWTRDASVGKAVYGVCRQEQVVFVLIQKDGGSSGITVPDLITRLVAMGVDDAVMGDGSDSATLILDGSVEVPPGTVKNNSIPVGPAFRLHALRLTGLRTLTNTSPSAKAATTDPRFKPPITVSNTTGAIRLTNAGLDLEITLLGSGGRGQPDPVSILGLTFPLRLSSSTSLITAGVALTSTPPSVTGNLTLVPTQVFDGNVIGNLTFTTNKGAAQFDFNWQVDDAP